MPAEASDREGSILNRVSELARKYMNRSQWLLRLFFLSAFAIFAVACAGQPEYGPPPIIGSDVVIEASSLQPGIPVFYTHLFKKKKISFFVVKQGETVMSFLDACNACYLHKRGYKFEQGRVVCRYCNERYPIEQIAEGFGNCYPIRLPGRLEGDRYRIATLSLEKSAGKF